MYSVQGKGIFVANFDRGKAENSAVEEMRMRLKEIAAFAERNSVGRDAVKRIIKEIWEDI